MQKFLLLVMLALACITANGQQYFSGGGLESLYKGKYQFTARLDEKNNTLIFETDAPLSVITLETYTVEELSVRKGKEYTDIYYTKRGNVYSYDLRRPELKGKYAYWLKLSIGRNGSPFAEYYFQQRVDATPNKEEGGGEEKNAAGETIIRTNASCPEGKAKLERELKALDGVRKVTIDPRGTVLISYSPDGTPYRQLLATITDNGFNANNLQTSNASANPCNKKENKTITLTPNILDATAGYKKAAIKFVPIKADYSKGYSDTKIYEWTDSADVKHKATGKEILDEVNKLEEQLNQRGHSLRDKKPFDGLTFPLKQVAKNDLSNCVIINKLTKPPAGPIYKFTQPKKLKDITIAKNMVASTVYSYVGYITNSAEFKEGNMSSAAKFNRVGSNATASLQLVFHSAMYPKLSTCKIEVSKNPGGNVLFSTKINIKQASAVLNAAQAKLNFGDAVEPQHLPANYLIRSYDLFFTNVASILPPETCQEQPYYLKLSFYDLSGKLIETYQPNDLVLNNQLSMPMNLPVTGSKNFVGYNYEFLDPGLHCFGFYAKSNGHTADYFSQGQGYTGMEKRASINANMEIGVKYYNWQRLIDNNAPLTKDYVLFGYDIRSEEKYTRADNCLPPIIKKEGYKKENPDYGVVSLLGESYNLANPNTNTFTKPIDTIQIADVNFFIGPVPCNINVNITGSTSISVDYQSITNSYCAAKATITPHADITLHGSGGVQALIMYAKVFADVKLLEIDMPYTLEASNIDAKAAVDQNLMVGGLSGEVYFQAGFCIPIPLVDDICESFRIDILNWKGFEKSFKVDPKKGIVL